MPDELSKIVDKLTLSLFYVVITTISLIIFGYSLTLNLDSVTAPVLQVFVLAFAMFSFIHYLTDGIMRISTLRKFENKINEIDRCDTFEELYDLL